jgi:hypothetical protein
MFRLIARAAGIFLKDPPGPCQQQNHAARRTCHFGS